MCAHIKGLQLEIATHSIANDKLKETKKWRNNLFKSDSSESSKKKEFLSKIKK